jgi:hypothetical protein
VTGREDICVRNSKNARRQILHDAYGNMRLRYEMTTLQFVNLIMLALFHERTERATSLGRSGIPIVPEACFGQLGVRHETAP